MVPLDLQEKEIIQTMVKQVRDIADPRMHTETSAKNSAVWVIYLLFYVLFLLTVHSIYSTWGYVQNCFQFHASNISLL